MTIVTQLPGEFDEERCEWTVAEAKAKFSKLIGQAQSKGPQIVTRRGRATVVVVSAEEWERKTRRSGSLADFFADSPLPGSGMQVERLNGRYRSPDR